MLFLFIVVAVLLLAFLGGKKGGKWSARLFLLEYVTLLFILSVLVRPTQAARVYNLTPFWSYLSIREGDEFLLTQIIANVAAFIPIGLLISLAFPSIRWWFFLLIGCAFSLFIETLQFFLKCGFAEFDDVFNNVLGCLIGLWIYVAITRIIGSISNKRKLASNNKLDT